MIKYKQKKKLTFQMKRVLINEEINTNPIAETLKVVLHG